MSEDRFVLLDEYSVKDPEVLLELLASLLDHQKMVTKALSMTIMLLLNHLGEVPDPPSEVRETSYQLLGEFVRMATEEWQGEATANQLRDLLNARE